MVVICEDKEYTISLLDLTIKDLWREIKNLSPKIGTDTSTEMNITRLLFLADEAQQHYYLLSRSEKAVLSSNLYHEIAERYSINIEKFTFAGELTRS